MHNDQTVTRYLLGALPDAETERLHELSFTDDEFAEALKAAEKDLVDSYVQGELTGATLERFKSHYLASPLRREKVKFARAFQLVAGKSAATKPSAAVMETQDKSATKRKGSRRFFSLGFLAAPRPALQWGMAFATLTLLVTIGWLAFKNAHLPGQPPQTATLKEQPEQREQELQREREERRSAGAETELELARAREERERLEQELRKQESERQQRATGQQPARPGRVGIAFFTFVPQMRDAAQIREVSIPLGAGYVAMRLELEPNDFYAYRAALIDQAGSQTLWRSGKLRARAMGDDKALSVRFRAELLKPQTVYLLRVTGTSDSGTPEIVGDYPFRVVE